MAHRFALYPEYRIADSDWKPYRGMNVRERKNIERGNYEDAQVCLNCTLKKCRGEEDCFRRMKAKMKGESE